MIYENKLKKAQEQKKLESFKYTTKTSTKDQWKPCEIREEVKQPVQPIPRAPPLQNRVPFLKPLPLYKTKESVKLSQQKLKGLMKKVDSEFEMWDFDRLKYTIKNVRRVKSTKYLHILRNQVWTKDEGGLVFIVEARACDGRTTNVWMTESEAKKYASDSY